MTAPKRRFDDALLAFFVLTFAISWGALGALQIIATTSDLGPRTSDLGAWQDLTHSAETAFDLARHAGALVVPTWLVHVLNVVADVGPSLSAVIVAAASGRLGLLVARLGRWRVGGRWHLVAFGLPAAVMGAARSR